MINCLNCRSGSRDIGCANSASFGRGAVTFATWLILGIVVALLNVPNFDAKRMGAGVHLLNHVDRRELRVGSAY